MFAKLKQGVADGADQIKKKVEEISPAKKPNHEDEQKPVDDGEMPPSYDAAKSPANEHRIPLAPAAAAAADPEAAAAADNNAEEDDRGAGVTGFLKRHLAKGVQMVPKIKVTQEKADDGSALRDIKSAEFNTEHFVERGCMNDTFFVLSFVFLLSYFATLLSDVYSLYALKINPAIPNALFIVYLVIFVISLFFVFTEVNIASRRLVQDDFSAIILDDLACQFFVVRSFGHFCLVDKVKSKFGITDKVVLKVMYGLQNGRKLLMVTLPQAICMFIALLYKGNVNANLSFAIKVLPYVIKFVLLYSSIYTLFLLAFVYPCLKCAIKLRQKENMSLWDYMNLMVEKILNKFLKDPKAGDPNKANKVGGLLIDAM